MRHDVGLDHLALTRGVPLPDIDAAGSPARSIVRAALTAIVVGALAFSTGQPAAAAGTTASVSGTVTGSAGQPLANELVYLFKDLGGTGYEMTASAYTDATGAFLIAGVAASRYTIRFYPVAGHVGEWWNDQINGTLANKFDLGAGVNLVGMDAQLSTGATISGVVRDTSAVPVYNSTVALYGVNEFNFGWGSLKTVKTDANGAYQFGVLNPGQYAVRVTPASGSELVEHWWPDSPYEAGATRFAVSRDQVVVGTDLILPRGSGIEGTVADEAGRPLSGVKVTAVGDGDPGYAYDSISLNSYTNTQGGYAFGQLKAGTYRLFFDAPIAQNYLTTRSETFDVGRGEVVTGKNATLVTGASISGVVTGRDGLPLPSVRVALIAANQSSISPITTDDNGAYRFQRLVGDDYTLSFGWSGSGYYRDDRDYFDEWWQDSPDRDGADFVSLETGQQLTGLDASLTPESTISGTVIDSNGQGTSANVKLYSAENGVLSYLKYAYVLSDGRYRFDDMRAGTYSIKFSSTDHLTEWWGDQLDESQAQTFTVGTGQIITGMDTALSAGASISGNLTGPDGSPLRSTIMNFYTVGPTGPVYFSNQLTDNLGHYYRAGLSAGNYLVRFSGPSSQNLADEWWNNSPDAENAEVVTLAPYQSRVLDAQLALATVSLSVPVLSGTAVVGSTLTAAVSSNPSGAARTYQWLSNGSTIAGATSSSLLLGPAELGKTITVRVTATAPGFAQGSKESAATAPVAAATLGASRPWASGSPTTGSVLAANTGIWTVGTSFTYQWFASGLLIDGATAETLTLSSDLANKRISVRVSGSKPGYTSTSRTSDPTPKVFLAGSPTILGTPVVGSTLAVNAGVWAGRSVFRVQWYAGGSPIWGATSRSLRLTAAHLGQQITVQVVGFLPGYPSAIRFSAPTVAVVAATAPLVAGNPAPAAAAESFDRTRGRRF